MDLLFFDTETGGLDPDIHSLLQVGMAAYVRGKVVDVLDFTVRKENYMITASALNFNKLNLYEDVYVKGIKEREAVERIIQFSKRNFKKDIPVLCGHNPSLDKYMIRKIFTRTGYDMDKFFNHRMLDTMSILWALYDAGKIPLSACSSDGAYKHFGITIDRQHNALDDCLGTVELYKKLHEILIG